MSTSQPLRILHLIDSGGLYGAEKVLLALASECRTMGHEPIVGTMVAPSDGGDPLGDAARQRGLRHKAFYMPDGFRLRGLREILRFARDETVDIVHTHGYRPNIMMAMVPQRFRPCPAVTTLHGWTATGRVGKLAIYEALERALLSRLDGVVIVSEAMRCRLPSVTRSVATLVPNGIETDSSRTAPRRAKPHGVALPDSGLQPVALAAGRLSHEKGFDLLLDAIGLLRDDGLNVKLVLAGNGPEMDRLRAQTSKLNLSEQVDFRGFVPDMGPLYSAVDLLVIPSRNEGLPLVLLEAMANGIPVVATCVGQIPKVLEDGSLGLLVPPGSSQELSSAMRLAILNYDQSNSRAELAKSVVQTTYSASMMARRYEHIYRSQLN